MVCYSWTKKKNKTKKKTYLDKEIGSGGGGDYNNKANKSEKVTKRRDRNALLSARCQKYD